MAGLSTDSVNTPEKYTGRYFELVEVGQGKGWHRRYVERTDEIHRLREELRQARERADAPR